MDLIIIVRLNWNMRAVLLNPCLQTVAGEPGRTLYLFLAIVGQPGWLVFLERNTQHDDINGRKLDYYLRANAIISETEC